MAMPLSLEEAGWYLDGAGEKYYVDARGEEYYPAPDGPTDEPGFYLDANDQR